MASIIKVPDKYKKLIQILRIILNILLIILLCLIIYQSVAALYDRYINVYRTIFCAAVLSSNTKLFRIVS